MNNSISKDAYFIEFGLIKDPFPVGVIDKKIFLTPEINRRLKHIKQLIAEGENLIIVTSVSGAGKSLLAQKLIVLKEENWRTSLVAAYAEMDPESLACAVVQHLLPGTNGGKKQSISRLHKFLEQSHKEEIRPVIVIDDADRLPGETLQFILQLADLRYNESLFRIVLFANESINEALSKTGLRELAEGNVDLVTMPGFTLEQIPAYLNYRFSSCGDDVPVPFSEIEIEYLYQASGGLPAGINLLARKLMQDSINKNKPGKNYGSPALLLSILILALAAYLYYESAGIRKQQGPYIQQVISAPVQEQASEGSPAYAGLTGPNELSALDDSISLKLSDVLTIHNGE